ncbi:MAG: hypothetical protein M1368_09150 [Thaumarchaeota archaeon]|nr:hypothetical protein [Nitrososphaerota archaeon]
MAEVQYRRSDDLAEAHRIMKFMTIGLGALWALDGFLQLQPQMFTKDLPLQVIGMGLMGLPPELYLWSENILYRILVPNIVLWNSIWAGLQLGIGFSLLIGSSRIKRIALVTSVVWGILVWLFGEGMAGLLTMTPEGGFFPGTPSMLSGFPGAALIYIVIALFLLLIPAERWVPLGRFSIVRDAPLILFLLEAAVQFAPAMWTSYGQSSIFAANIENLPVQLERYIVFLARYTIAHPILSNSLEVTAILLSAFGIFWARSHGLWAYSIALVWLGFVWWFALGLGAILTGLGTDPNTPLVIALLMVPGIAWRRYSKRINNLKKS